MFRDLFINACILVSILFVSSQIFKNSGLDNRSSLKIKALAGLIGGILGCILMYFTIYVTETVILDFRQIEIVIISISTGPFSTIVTGVIMVIFRIVYFG